MMYSIKVKDKVITGVQPAYADQGVGEVLAIVGSRGYLEIAVNQGNALQILDSGLGENILISL